MPPFPIRLIEQTSTRAVRPQERPRTRKSIVGCVLIIIAMVLGGQTSAYGRDELPPSVQQALSRAAVPLDHAAAFVQQVDAPRPALAWNARRPMNPASVMKLVTTYAGLDLLGPDFRWKTSVHASNPVEHGALNGDLILRGSGDPRLTIEYLTTLIGDLRKLGLAEIRGDLVLDRSYFDAVDLDAAAFDQEPLRPYNVGPYALLANFKAVKFQFVPDPGRRLVMVEPEPKLAQVELQHSIRLSNGRCNDWRAGIKTEVSGSATAARIAFSGSIPIACGEQSMYLSVLSHPEFVFGAFKSLWEEQGGTLRGRWRESSQSLDAPLLYAHASPPLASVVRDINKFSNNVMARQLFLTLSAELMKLPGRADRSARSIQTWLRAQNIAMPELVLENGSGLSRIERISALGIGQLLLHAQKGPNARVFDDSLPIVGIDGTMRSRLHTDDIAGRALIKTGGLVDVATIAGYVDARDGRRFAVAFFVNHANAARTYAAQDAFLRWVFDGAATAVSVAGEPKATQPAMQKGRAPGHAK